MTRQPAGHRATGACGVELLTLNTAEGHWGLDGRVPLHWVLETPWTGFLNVQSLRDTSTEETQL